MADFEKPCLSLELEIFKSTTDDGEPAPAVETPSTSEISNQDGNRIAEREGNSDSNSNSNSKIVFRHKSQAIQSKKRSLTWELWSGFVPQLTKQENQKLWLQRNSTNYFFKDVRKENGEEYEPSSLTSFQRSFQRYFSEKKLLFNIFEDDEFSRNRQVFATKRKNLVQSGFGNKPNATRELTEEEQEKLFETRQFGDHDKKQGKAAVKLATDDLSLQSSSLQVMADARWNSTKRWRNTGLMKWRNQTKSWWPDLVYAFATGQKSTGQVFVGRGFCCWSSVRKNKAVKPLREENRHR